jgi:hypothetical protein
MIFGESFMSSFLCSDLHISTVANGFVASQFCSFNNLSAGSILGDISEKYGFTYKLAAEAIWTANSFAVLYRYNEELKDAKHTPSQQFKKNITPLGMIRLTDCLIYQMSEFYESNPLNAAKFVCEVIKELTIYRNAIVSALTRDESWTI